MENLSVNYLGLELKSPIIVSSCGLTSKLETIKRIEESGAGAVVLKSLFEEQIMGEISYTEAQSDYPDAAMYITNYIKENSITNYLNLIKEVKANCSIPVIASICCLNGGSWSEFAKEIATAGADALELNIFFMPTSATQSSEELINSYLQTVAEVTESVNLPIAVKISSNFANPINIARELFFRRVKGIVMFNRFYDPDIDIENLTLTVANRFSTSSELRTPLRWIAMSSAVQPEIDYSATTGVHTGEDVVKMLLAGAASVQICSSLYLNGYSVIGEMNSFISSWMNQKGYTSISDFKGMLNYKNVDMSAAYERSQFMKYYSSYEK